MALMFLTLCNGTQDILPTNLNEDWQAAWFSRKWYPITSQGLGRAVSRSPYLALLASAGVPLRPTDTPKFLDAPSRIGRKVNFAAAGEEKALEFCFVLSNSRREKLV